jgi:RNA polymerase sigma-70 factor (ECF subfamily)
MTVPLEPENEEAISVTWETPESLAIASATREVLQEALGRLPVAYREVVLLCDVESMRYREIAEVLSIPVGTVMSRLARARKLLRQMLSGERVQTASEGGEQKR